jgi:transcriptional regulator with XRE-family HTH domain
VKRVTQIRHNEAQRTVTQGNARRAVSEYNMPSRWKNDEGRNIPHKLHGNLCVANSTQLIEPRRDERAKMKFLTGGYVRKWRELRKMSAAKLGRELGLRGREQVAHIECGSHELNPKFAARFDAYRNRTQSQERQARQFLSRYPLPRKIKNLVKPRKCKICREWFLMDSQQHGVCTGRECQREARRK